MNLADVLVSDAQQKTIELPIGEGGSNASVDVYLRKLPFSLVFDAKDEKGKAIGGNELIAKRVAHCYVDKEGNPIFTEAQLLGDDVKVVPADVVIALHEVIVEENNLGKIYGNLLMKMNSGANSLSTESAEKR